MISFRNKVIIVPFDIMHTLYIGVYYVILCEAVDLCWL